MMMIMMMIMMMMIMMLMIDYHFAVCMISSSNKEPFKMSRSFCGDNEDNDDGDDDD